MTIKRIILVILTFVAIAKVFLSLGESLNQPQVQSRLELYQTNLVLHAVTVDPSKLASEGEKYGFDLNQTLKTVIGDDPYSNAQKQYQKARTEAETTIANLQKQQEKLADLNTQISLEDSQESSSPATELQTPIIEIEKFIQEIDLKLGILQAKQGNTQQALTTWQNLVDQEELNNSNFIDTAQYLSNLWQEEPQKISPQIESNFLENLDGWFRYIALQKLYQSQENYQQQELLEQQEQNKAEQAIIKLALIGGLPLFGGIFGVSLLIFLIVQLVIKKGESILATNHDYSWYTPWDWETIWQVLIVGFFFIGQILLPIALGFINFDPSNLSLRFKATYVLVSYLLMALGGIIVLYISLKPFLPLKKDWFHFPLFNNWFIWSIGGYLVALPLVLIVSLINQQIWQGQGGSNPLLFLALQAQDQVALTIFFITASVAAPLFEELMFRGFLLPSLTRYVPLWSSILLSSLIFAVAHLSLSEVLPLTTLGIILGVVYTRTRNLLAPMLLHSLWNSGTLISLFILGSGV